MRILLFFDLPMKLSAERRIYSQFRKNLINSGYIMMQKSLYCRLVANYVAAQLEMDRITKISPSNGLIQCLVVTEKQYANVINVTGEMITNKVNCTSRLIII